MQAKSKAKTNAKAKVKAEFSYDKASKEFRCRLIGQPGNPVLISKDLSELETFLDELDNRSIPRELGNA